MNKAVASLFALLFAAPAYSQTHDLGNAKPMDVKSEKKSRSHQASGTVEKVDAARGTVTIAHGPVRSLNWPSMTMPFKTKDQKMLEQVRPGGRVDFDFEQRGKDYVITRIQ